MTKNHNIHLVSHDSYTGCAVCASICPTNSIKMPEGDVSHCISNYSIGNYSVAFKADLLNLIDFNEFQQQGFMSCDYIMYVIFSRHTQFGFLPDHTAVWRRGIESVSGTADMEKQMRYEQNGIAMWRYAAKLFPERWTATEHDIENYLHLRFLRLHFGMAIGGAPLWKRKK